MVTDNVGTRVHLGLYDAPSRTPRPQDVWLIHPPTLVAPRSLSYFGSVPSLGLAYVAGALRHAGHRVHVVDAPGEAYAQTWAYPTAAGMLRGQGLTVDEIVARIPVDAPIVGVTHMFLHEWGLVKSLFEALRRRAPGALLVAGGENASAHWPVMLPQCAAIDVCVLGEGEATMLELIDKWTAGGGLEDVPGLAVRREGEPIATAARQRLRSLDAWPRPAWDLFPLGPYLMHRGHGGVARGRSLPILTTRGCPYRCTFCSSPSMWTTRYERRDPARVVDEIEALVQRYELRNVDLHDLTAILTKPWLMALCDELIRRDVSICWQMPSGTRSEAIDAEAAQRLFAAGCRNIGYAPESGSPTLLARINKRVHLPALLASLRGSVAAGLQTEANIIIGFPHETMAEQWETVRFIVQLARAGLHSLSVMVFAPYPGSAEFDRLRESGAIAFDDAYLYGSLLRSAGGLRSYSPVQSARQLLATQLGMLLLFFAAQYTLRPGRAVALVSRAVRGRQETVVDQFVGTKARQLRAAAARVIERRSPTALGRWPAVLARWIRGPSIAVG